MRLVEAVPVKSIETVYAPKAGKEEAKGKPQPAAMTMVDMAAAEELISREAERRRQTADAEEMDAIAAVLLEIMDGDGEEGEDGDGSGASEQTQQEASISSSGKTMPGVAPRPPSHDEPGYASDNGSGSGPDAWATHWAHADEKGANCFVHQAKECRAPCQAGCQMLAFATGDRFRCIELPCVPDRMWAMNASGAVGWVRFEHVEALDAWTPAVMLDAVCHSFAGKLRTQAVILSCCHLRAVGATFAHCDRRQAHGRTRVHTYFFPRATCPGSPANCPHTFLPPLRDCSW